MRNLWTAPSGQGRLLRRSALGFAHPGQLVPVRGLGGYQPAPHERHGPMYVIPYGPLRMTLYADNHPRMRGATTAWCSRTARRWDHPRRRGGDGRAAWRRRVSYGPSPRARSQLGRL
jgi:hypothetical protein